MLWQAALRIGTDNFFLGIGPGMFQKHYLDYQKYFIPYLEWAVPQPHNILLAFWIQNGVFGVVGFVLLVFWFFKNGILRKNAGNRGLYALLMLIMVYFLAHGLVDTTYWKNDLSLVFWLIIFLAVYLNQPILNKD
jgi:O-antigen ligase